MVLFEALNVSEGRGTTVPFELFGAPFINGEILLRNLRERNIPGCSFRIHNFIPTFNKYTGMHCSGLQLHVNDIRKFRPVASAVEIIDAIIKVSAPGALKFNDPPYEYEYELMPFDILAGDDLTRKTLLSGVSLKPEFDRWDSDIESFKEEFSGFSLYGE
jgi:uncharacterized protein YbbC (DUF1343 family)